MRQHRWLELIKDYNLEVHYHPGKANVVADSLSQKSHCNTLEALLQNVSRFGNSFLVDQDEERDRRLCR